MLKAIQIQSLVDMATALVPLLDKEKYSVSSIFDVHVRLILDQ